jgi:hypothetical protein
MPPPDARPRRASSHSSGVAKRNGECEVQMAVQSVAKAVPNISPVAASGLRLAERGSRHFVCRVQRYSVNDQRPFIDTLSCIN